MKKLILSLCLLAVTIMGYSNPHVITSTVGGITTQTSVLVVRGNASYKEIVPVRLDASSAVGGSVKVYYGPAAIGVTGSSSVALVNLRNFETVATSTSSKATAGNKASGGTLVFERWLAAGTSVQIPVEGIRLLNASDVLYIDFTATGASSCTASLISILR